MDPEARQSFGVPTSIRSSKKLSYGIISAKFSTLAVIIIGIGITYMLMGKFPPDKGLYSLSFMIIGTLLSFYLALPSGNIYKKANWQLLYVLAGSISSQRHFIKTKKD